MEPVLIGYFAKQRTPRPPDLDVPANVMEIASVSGCIAHQPDEWIQQWKHNDWFVFDSPDVALSVASGLHDVRVYAYSVLPVVFTPVGDESLAITGVAPQPLSERFTLLGYDVASRSVTPEFECSPLSCNEMARETNVNEFCLLESIEAARIFAQRCAKEQPERGDYFVVAVRSA